MNIRRLERPSLHGYRVSSVHCTPYFSKMHFINIILYSLLHSKWLRSKIFPYKKLFTFLAFLSNPHYDIIDITNLRARYYRILTMVYNTHRYWVFGLFPSSGFEIYRYFESGRWTKSENPVSL
jgi:hypothetical protein